MGPLEEDLEISTRLQGSATLPADRAPLFERQAALADRLAAATGDPRHNATAEKARALAAECRALAAGDNSNPA